MINYIGLLVILFFSAHVFADDTDRYFGNVDYSSGKVMLLIDSSVSMGEILTPCTGSVNDDPEVSLGLGMAICFGLESIIVLESFFLLFLVTVGTVFSPNLFCLACRAKFAFHNSPFLWVKPAHQSFKC